MGFKSRVGVGEGSREKRIDELLTELHVSPASKLIEDVKTAISICRATDEISKRSLMIGKLQCRIGKVQDRNQFFDNEHGSNGDMTHTAYSLTFPYW